LKEDYTTSSVYIYCIQGVPINIGTKSQSPSLFLAIEIHMRHLKNLK